LDVSCGALLKLDAPKNTDTTTVIARLLRSSDQPQAANEAKFPRMERAAFEALCHRWPQRARREGLRMEAMVGLSAFRIAVDEWTDAGGKERFTRRIEKAFVALRTELLGVSD
jgi:hypothetical protein